MFYYIFSHKKAKWNASPCWSPVLRSGRLLRPHSFFADAVILSQLPLAVLTETINGGRVVLLVPAEFTVLTPSWVELIAEEGQST